MLTYSYACDACGHHFDQLQSMKDKPIRKCPKCGKLKTRRLITGGGGILFKGSGFYQTDYRSKSYTDAAKKDKPETKPEPKAETKSETKPSGDKKKG